MIADKTVKKLHLCSTKAKIGRQGEIRFSLYSNTEINLIQVSYLRAITKSNKMSIFL